MHCRKQPDCFFIILRDLKHHNGVGTLGDGRTGQDLGRLSGGKGPGRHRSRRDLLDDIQADGPLRGGVLRVGCPQGIAERSKGGIFSAAVSVCASTLPAQSSSGSARVSTGLASPSSRSRA